MINAGPQISQTRADSESKSNLRFDIMLLTGHGS